MDRYRENKFEVAKPPFLAGRTYFIRGLGEHKNHMDEIIWPIEKYQNKYIHDDMRKWGFDDRVFDKKEVCLKCGAHAKLEVLDFQEYDAQFKCVRCKTIKMKNSYTRKT